MVSDLPDMSSLNAMADSAQVAETTDEPRGSEDGSVAPYGDLGTAADHAVLDLAIGEGQIVPWYQPIVDLTTGEVHSLEALARWQRPDGRVLPAAAFVPAAERTGRIHEMDHLIATRSLADLRGWQVHHPDLRLSVNVSGRALEHEDWAQVLHDLVLASGVRPATIDLELTETFGLSAPDRAADELQWLREQGYAVWLDDFGIGWSQLRDLIRLPIDGLKIDRYFTEAPRQSAPLVRAVDRLAQDLGLGTVVEGIATVEQLRWALDLGCALGQGFLWAEPMPAADVDPGHIYEVSPDRW